MKYEKLILPAGWKFSKSYKTLWIRPGKKSKNVVVRDLTNPHDYYVRVFPQTLNAETLERLQCNLAGYGDSPAYVL